MSINIDIGKNDRNHRNRPQNMDILNKTFKNNKQSIMHELN